MPLIKVAITKAASSEITRIRICSNTSGADILEQLKSAIGDVALLLTSLDTENEEFQLALESATPILSAYLSLVTCGVPILRTSKVRRIAHSIQCGIPSRHPRCFFLCR